MLFRWAKKLWTLMIIYWCSLVWFYFQTDLLLPLRDKKIKLKESTYASRISISKWPLQISTKFRASHNRCNLVIAQIEFRVPRIDKQGALSCLSNGFSQIISPLYCNVIARQIWEVIVYLIPINIYFSTFNPGNKYSIKWLSEQ